MVQWEPPGITEIQLPVQPAFAAFAVMIQSIMLQMPHVNPPAPSPTPGLATSGTERGSKAVGIKHEKTRGTVFDKTKRVRTGVVNGEVNGEVVLRTLSLMEGKSLWILDLLHCSSIDASSMELILEGIRECFPGVVEINVSEGCNNAEVLRVITIRARQVLAAALPLVV